MMQAAAAQEETKASASQNKVMTSEVTFYYFNIQGRADPLQ